MPSVEEIHRHRIKTHFESELTDYDYCAEKVVPRNLEMQHELVAAIPLGTRENLRMLDLGAGTGQTAAIVLGEFSNSTLHCVDVSKTMLDVAEKRLAKFGSRVTLEQGDFCEIPLKGQFDAVFSAVAIHNCMDADKKKLFRKIGACLKSGGVFVNADFVRFASEDLNRKASQRYFDYMTNTLAGEELSHWLRHAKEEDKPATIEDQASWLKNAGFAKIECTWAYQNLACYTAFKS